MLGASFLPARFRHEHTDEDPSWEPGSINLQVTSFLQWVSCKAFTHPINTIVSVALVASTCYIGLLEGSLLDHTSLGHNNRGVELDSLVKDGKHLRVGDDTAWKWRVDLDEPVAKEGVSPPLLNRLELRVTFSRALIALCY